MRVLLPTALFTLSSCFALASAQATFEELGPGSLIDADSSGTLVLGQGPPPLDHWILDLTTGNRQPVGAGGSPTALADDGIHVIGNHTDPSGVPNPAIWTAAGGWQDLGGLPGEPPGTLGYGNPWDISAAGDVVVGRAWLSTGGTRGFRWSAVAGMIELSASPYDWQSEAYCVSRDGQWTGGYAGNSAALWDAQGNVSFPLVTPENPGGEGAIRAINSDGSAFAGKTLMPNGLWRGFVWTQSGGLRILDVLPGELPGFRESVVTGISDDGSVAVGVEWTSPYGLQEPILWRPETGTRRLKDYLTELGATVTLSLDYSESCVSSDGTTIIGISPQSMGSGSYALWRATIPAAHGPTSSFCLSAPNSVGPGAYLTSNGHTSVVTNDLVLAAAPVPDQPGLFFFADGWHPPIPFGDGHLCAGGPGHPLHRFPPQNAVAHTLTRAVDFAASPVAGQWVPGSTWYVQAWYRDPLAGGAGSNLSNGLALTLAP